MALDQSKQQSAKWRVLWWLLPVVVLAVSATYFVAVQRLGYSLAKEGIEEEIAALPDHDWAGEYYYGDGLGVNVSLSLAPDTGFVFTWNGCMGEYDRNYGDVTVTDGVLRLNPRLRNDREGFQGIAVDLLPVRWGARHYLIASDEVIDFCDAVNKGLEPRDGAYGSFFLRDGDWQTAVLGWPELPVESSRYLLKEPILAEISAIGPTVVEHGRADIKFKITTVTLNVGKQHGVLPGMGFVMVDPNDVVSTLVASTQVITVGQDECEAKITQIGEESATPQLGWRFSTRSPWLNNE